MLVGADKNEGKEGKTVNEKKERKEGSKGRKRNDAKGGGRRKGSMWQRWHTSSKAFLFS
jgi:hypothetical protein